MDSSIATSAMIPEPTIGDERCLLCASSVPGLTRMNKNDLRLLTATVDQAFARKSLIAAIVLLTSLAGDARGQTPGPNAVVKTTTVPLDRPNEQQPRNVKTEWVTHKGREALRVSDAAPPD